MQKAPFQRFALWAAAAVCLGTITNSATAGGGSFTRGCAARDMQILQMIEHREITSTVPTDILSDAMLTMMHARIVCYEGYVVDALAIYDAIARSITPISGSVRPAAIRNPMTRSSRRQGESAMFTNILSYALAS